ncbi:hypothetical protein GDO78_019847 [Eleutherodactylus coqui]|uniref:Tc1-like transposase DDE domain-containing protein n=1 Tax=Eleutherodactylus coqui TaxID=57060 RepID=A0A8J6BD08_ELECQ|nr:hypothetical protein GDO78_019847 [Eleutherodactylus coqui]
MVGAALCGGCPADGTGALVKGEGIMNSPKYQSMLVQNLQASAEKMKRNFTFRHDDPKQTDKSPNERLHQKIKGSEWPNQSPDLNPIEDLW